MTTDTTGGAAAPAVVPEPAGLGAESLGWRCPPAALGFATTAELPPTDDALGQERALEALRFAVGVRSPAHHVYAMGAPETDRHDAVLAFLRSAARGGGALRDWCYVNRFDDPRRPRILTLEPGRGAQFKRDMAELIADLRAALPGAFESDNYRGRVGELEQEFDEREQRATRELAEEASRHQLGLVRTPDGFAIAPVRDGGVMPPDEFQKLPQPQRDEALAQITRLTERLRAHIERLPQWQREKRQRLRELDRQVGALAVKAIVGELRGKYAAHAGIVAYLDEVEADLVDNAQLFRPVERPPWMMLGEAGERALGLRRYEVNLLVDNGATQGPPIVYEANPGHQNLLGRVENVAQFGTLSTDFTMVRAGALHRANGGCLVLDAARLLAQPYAWEALKRALTARRVDMESLGAMLSLVSTSTIEPEPVELDVKVVLVGPRDLYDLLSFYDEDFAALFSVVADFAGHVERDDDTLPRYARVLATQARRAGLAPLDCGAVARVIEHSARLAGDSRRLTAHVRTLVDLIREADYWAREAGRDVIAAADVEHAIDTEQRRVDRIRELSLAEIQRGHVHIQTDGGVVAQVNGLSVVDLGRAAFGHPSRITATVRIGEGDVIDIEREVKLGGAIHTKGVLILSSFIAARYAADVVLALHASLVFEQTYGGVEGDSASLAETCALLSALAELPIDQGRAVTGAIDQHGRVQVVGGVSDKIEGFFDVCARRGLTGRQGVLLPAGNVEHLMLRSRVVDAVAQGRFHIWPVRTVDEAMALLTGLSAGELDADDAWPLASVNGRVQFRLMSFARTLRDFTRGDGDGRDAAKAAGAGDAGVAGPPPVRDR